MVHWQIYTLCKGRPVIKCHSASTCSKTDHLMDSFTGILKSQTEIRFYLATIAVYMRSRIGVAIRHWKNNKNKQHQSARMQKLFQCDWDLIKMRPDVVHPRAFILFSWAFIISSQVFFGIRCGFFITYKRNIASTFSGWLLCLKKNLIQDSQSSLLRAKMAVNLIVAFFRMC